MHMHEKLKNLFPVLVCKLYHFVQQIPKSMNKSGLRHSLRKKYHINWLEPDANSGKMERSFLQEKCSTDMADM